MIVAVDAVTKEFQAGSGALAAVDDVTLSVGAGESVAIIGPNGAGKSTLLGLIAGIHVPTRGQIRRPRRCAALLELGAGFHADLTGRENLDLTLAVAGVPRSDRARRRAAAIEFAGLGSAIDLPAKHLSSGMIGRLACAGALHTDPDLLLIDEVLAVGDSAFQREMLSGVEAMLADGMALLLVTHSPELAAVATSRTVWLKNGHIVEDGPTHEVLNRYEAAVRGWGRSFAPPTVEIERLALEPERIQPGDPLRMVADLRCSADTGPLQVRVEVRPVMGEDSIWMRSEDDDETLEMRQLNLVAVSSPAHIELLTAGRHRVALDLPSVPISPTEVELSMIIADGEQMIIDEVTATLVIGSAQLRPHYHLEVEAQPRNTAP